MFLFVQKGVQVGGHAIKEMIFFFFCAVMNLLSTSKSINVR